MAIKYKTRRRKDGTVSVTRTTHKPTLAERLAVTLKPYEADKKRRRSK